MIPKPAHQITLADLRALVGNVPEGKTIEYKRELPAKTRDELVKFLAAVSSFANTAGGDLLIGVEAKNCIPEAIIGVAFGSLDDEKLRLEQILATHLEPRLPHIDIQPVGCGNGRHVMLIRAHRSWIAPHRLALDNKFYGRNSAGKYPLDVGELRTAFALSESTAERIRNFRNDRLIKIVARETPLVLHPGAAMVIHVVPFSTFATGRNMDVVQTLAGGYVLPLPPGRMYQSNNYAANLDGFATFTNQPNEPAHAYAQLFRSGAIEGVDLVGTDEKNGTPYLSGPTFENTAVSAIKNYVALTQSIDLGLPVFVFLSFCGMKGCVLRTRTEFGGGYYDAGPLRQDVIALPEVSLDSSSTDIPTAMRLSFNTIWNAFGFGQSDKYDSRGKWIGTA
jgi:hypothetical protein